MGNRDAVTADARASADDLELVGKLLAGDEAAFTSLVERHHGALVRLARAFVADHEAALEVVQETNQRVLLHRARSGLRRALEKHLDGK